MVKHSKQSNSQESKNQDESFQSDLQQRKKKLPRRRFFNNCQVCGKSFRSDKLRSHLNICKIRHQKKHQQTIPYGVVKDWESRLKNLESRISGILIPDEKNYQFDKRIEIFGDALREQFILKCQKFLSQSELTADALLQFSRHLSVQIIQYQVSKVHYFNLQEAKKLIEYDGEKLGSYKSLLIQIINQNPNFLNMNFHIKEQLELGIFYYSDSSSVRNKVRLMLKRIKGISNFNIADVYGLENVENKKKINNPITRNQIKAIIIELFLNKKFQQGLDVYAVYLTGLRSTDWTKIDKQKFQPTQIINKTKKKHKIILNTQWYVFAAHFQWKKMDMERVIAVKKLFKQKFGRVYDYKHGLLQNILEIVWGTTANAVGINKANLSSYVRQQRMHTEIRQALTFLELNIFLDKKQTKLREIITKAYNSVPHKYKQVIEHIQSNKDSPYQILFQELKFWETRKTQNLPIYQQKAEIILQNQSNQRRVSVSEEQIFHVKMQSQEQPQQNQSDLNQQDYFVQQQNLLQKQFEKYQHLSPIKNTENQNFTPIKTKKKTIIQNQQDSQQMSTAKRQYQERQQKQFDKAFDFFSKEYDRREREQQRREKIDKEQRSITKRNEKSPEKFYIGNYFYGTISEFSNKCCRCLKNYTPLIIKDCYHMVSCSCDLRQHSCKEIPSYQQLTQGQIIQWNEPIETSLSKFEVQILAPNYLLQKINGLDEFIKMRNRVKTDKIIYDNLIPRSITWVKLPTFEQKVAKIILQNRLNQDYLPLEIKQLAFGFGVFAKENIEKGTLICSYLGEMIFANHIKWTPQNDSIFDVGWIKQKLLVIQTFLYSNIARFINSGKNGKNNCASRKAYLKYQSIKQFCIIIYAIQDIKKGDQLRYYYDFPKHMKKNRKKNKTND